MNRALIVATTLGLWTACGEGSMGSGPRTNSGLSVSLAIKSATFALSLSGSGALPDPSEGQGTGTCAITLSGQATYALDASASEGVGALASPPGREGSNGPPVVGSLNFVMAGTSSASRTTGGCLPCGPSGASLATQTVTLALSAPSANTPLRVTSSELLAVPVDKVHACSGFKSTDYAVKLDDTTPATLTQLAGNPAAQTWEFTGTQDLSATTTNPASQATGTQTWRLTLEVVPTR